MGRLGTKADVLITESALGMILDAIDNMLLESSVAGVLLAGVKHNDDNGDYYEVTGISESDAIGICVGSQEGGVEPDDKDLILFKKHLQKGVLMKADVYAHQFSAFLIDDEIEEASILFRE